MDAPGPPKKPDILKEVVLWSHQSVGAGVRRRRGGFTYLEGAGAQQRIPLTMAGGFESDALAFSRDGKLLAGGTDGGVVFVADIQEALRRWSNPSSRP